MLQITSGQFWGQVKRFDIQSQVPLYSVAKIRHQIRVPEGTLTPINLGKSNIQGITFSYQHGLPIPAGGVRGGTDLAPPGDEIEDQMIALLTVYTNRFWDRSVESIVKVLERAKKAETQLPHLVTSRDIDSDKLAQFINHAVSLPRTKYRAISTAAAALHHAIQASLISYDAAFSIVIFAIESLVPAESETPPWSYMPLEIQKNLGKVLENTEETVAEQVRTILLEDRHFNLQTKFIKFAEEHISKDFHRSKQGVRLSDLRRLLRNAYNGRSEYAHKLISVKRPSLGVHTNQSVTWHSGEPQLTLQGAFLLACEIIRCYVESGPHLPYEEGVHWRSEIPGVVYSGSQKLDR